MTFCDRGLQTPEAVHGTKLVILTDIDATLKDRGTHSYSASLPALGRVLRIGSFHEITSRTTREITYLNNAITSQLDPDLQGRRSPLAYPHVFENGGGIIVPGTFASDSLLKRIDFGAGAEIMPEGEQDWLIQLARPIQEARTALDIASRYAHIPIRTLAQMTPFEFSGITGLSEEQSKMALDRRFQEGFRLTQDASEEQISILRSNLADQGFRLTKGGNFWQVTGGSDKGRGAAALKAILEHKYGEQVFIVGLGDAPSDFDFLKLCDTGYLIKNPSVQISESDIPEHVVQIDQEGSIGWNSAVNGFLDKWSALK